MWAMSITGHSISHRLPCPVPSWVPNIIGTRGGNSVKFSKKKSYIRLADSPGVSMQGCVAEAVLGWSVTPIGGLR